MTYPSNAVITYTPDAAGRMLSAVDSGNPSAGASGQAINYVTGASYGPDNALTGFISGQSSGFAGMTNAFSYNRRLQPVNMSASSPAQTVFFIGYDFHLGNGNNGNVYGIINYKDNNRNQAFTYDSLNRLISAQNAGTDCSVRLPDGHTEYWGNSYVYDAWGNLLQKNVTKCTAENMLVTADVHNWIHTGAAPDYGYDAAGNMTSDPTDGVSMTYDAENRIATATKSGVATTYTYDADGNRVKKNSGTGGTLYWYMAPGIVAESDLSGVLKSEYVFFDGERVARKDFPVGNIFYYFSDHLKTASVITDSTGHITDESDYYPWGGELQLVSSGTNRYKFGGHEHDNETGLEYYGARYYGNALGRFLTSDWSAIPVPVPYADLHDPQSLNQYAYTRNNPITKSDPDGHDGCGYFCQIVHDAKDFVHASKMEKQAALDRMKRDIVGKEAVSIPSAGPVDTSSPPNNPGIPAGLIKHLPTSQDGGEKPQTRSQALNNAKRDANIPTSAQPNATKYTPLTDSNGKPVINPSTGQPVQSREYTYTTSDGNTVVIQDHSQGHQFDDGGSVDSHFNVRPPVDTRHGTVPGTKSHYPYEPRKHKGQT